MKKVISVLLSVLMLCSMTTGLDLTAYAADTTITGKCGESATYTFDKNTKTLTISGTGVIDDRDYDFPSDSSIASLIIEDGITRIGDWMFFECKNLKNIVIPDSLVSISSHAFIDSKYYNDDSNWQDNQLYINNALIDVKSDGISSDFVIKDGTSVVGDSALAYLDITSVYIPKSVKGITGATFFCCNYLKTIDVDPNNQYYTSDNGVLFNKDKTMLVGYPKSAENEFYRIPNSVKKIGKYAFCDSTNLLNLDIPNGVEMIEEYAVDGCDSLTSIVIPNSVTHIGSYAFSSRNLNKIDMSSNIESVDHGAFDYTAYYDNQSNWENGVLYIGPVLIKANDDLEGVYRIKDSTRVIAASAFCNCGVLDGVYIPDGVVAINDGAFDNCSSIRDITIPATVTTIGKGAFQSTDLLVVYIQGTNVTVGNFAFYDSGNTVVFCHSTTQFGSHNNINEYYIDKVVAVKNFKDLYSSDYDWDHYTLFSFVANESGTYYSGGDYWNSDYMYIFDENYNLVNSNKIDSIAGDEEEPTGGFSFNLEKGRTYYFPYGGGSSNQFEVIKDYQYIDPGKQYIQGDKNCEYLKIVYPDDSFRMEKYYGRDNIDVSQPVTLQYCGKIITFSLNDPVTINSIEVLNSQYIDSGFIAGLKVWDGKVIEKYPVVYRLHLSNGKTYDIENYSMWCGAGNREPTGYWGYYECSAADGRKFGIEFTYNDSKPNELKVLVNSRYSDTSPSVIVAANNEHIHNFVLTATNPPTCLNAGGKTYTCTICEKEEHKDETPALGHAYIAQVIAQPTCTAKGVIRYTCSRCGDSYDEENIDALGHSYAKTIIGPTCTTQGYTAYVCTVCGEEEHRDKTPALGHQYKSQLTKATTAKDGQTYKKCTVCGAVTGKTVIAKVSNIKLNKTAYTYNGKVQKPSVAVKDSKGKTLKKGTDYTVSYSSGCKNVGRYTVKVTLKGNYSGSKSMTYNINPKGTSVSKVKAAKKGFKVTWKKQTTQTTGYQVQYSTSSKFKKAKTVTISKNKTTSKSVSKLSAKKKYYVRVRTYKTVKVNGKNVKLYSGWSKAKSVTTKK